MVRQIRRRLSSLQKVLRARRECLAIASSAAPRHVVMEGGILTHILLLLLTTRRFHPADYYFRTRVRLQRDMGDWIRGRLAETAEGTVFHGDFFTLLLPGQFKNATSIVVNDLREQFCENIYSRYLPFSSSVRAGDVVLDCGANIGSFSVWAATRTCDIQVVAIEPEEAICRALRRNVDANGLSSRVRIERTCLSDRAGEAILVTDTKCFTMTRMALDGTPAPSENVERVPTETIDSLVSRLGVPRVDFIKMDIEGAKRLALQGAAETIRRFRPRLAISGYHLRDDMYVLTTLICRLCPDYDVVMTNDLYIYANADRVSNTAATAAA